MSSLETHGPITPGMVKRARKSSQPVLLADSLEQAVEQCRTIVAEKQMAAINGYMIDLFTASAVVKVYDALSDEQRGRIHPSVTITRFATFAFKVIK